MLRVVSGVTVRRGGLVLMGLRKPDRARPSLWELPGGKLETSETPQQALAREWGEELCIYNPIVGAFITSAMFELEQPFEVSLYCVSIIEEPVAKDHVELRWVHPGDAVRHLPCSPAFYLHYAHLKRWMSF